MKNSLKIKVFFKVSLISLLLFVFLDFLIGKNLYNYIFTNNKPVIKHEIYHHDFKPNFNKKIIYSPEHNAHEYTLCTDINGFKSKCGLKNKDKNFDIAFMGDSFTEGDGLNYEDTFVGLFSNKHPNLNIANLAVESYSPTIYFAKIKYLLNSGYHFDRIIIFLDIGDILDENYYFIKDGKVQRLKYSNEVFKSFSNIKKTKEIIKRNFYFTSFVYYKMIELKMYLQKSTQIREVSNYQKDRLLINSRWTYNNKFSEDDQIWINNGINKTKKMLENIFSLSKKHDIKVSIAIYPWPAQIYNETKPYKMQKIWKSFCENKCEFFIDNIQLFDDQKNQKQLDDIVSHNYFKKDLHFNKNGNKLIFKNLDKYLNKL